VADSFDGKLVLRDPRNDSARLVFGDADAGTADDAAAPGALVFRQPRGNSGKLVFGGAGGGAVAAPGATVSLDADLPGLDGALTLRAGALAGVDANLPGLDADVPLVWDAQAARALLSWHAPRLQDAAPVAAAVRARWQRSQLMPAAHRSRWQQAQGASAVARPHWQQSAALGRYASAVPGRGQSVQQGARAAFEQSLALRAVARTAAERGVPALYGARAAYQEALQLRAGARSSFEPGQSLLAAARATLRAGRPLYSLRLPRWQEATYPSAGRSQRPKPPEPPVHPPLYDPQRLGLLVFEQARTGGGKLLFICRDHTEPPPATVAVLRRRSYIVLNSIEVRLAATGQPLPALDSGFSMRLDHQSWTWGFSVSLHAAALPLLTPGDDGLPVELRVNVNGQPFAMLAQSMRRSVKFPRAVIEVTGAGKAALLDAPYAAAQTFSQPGDRTAQQLMQDVLGVNGVSMGWSLDWQLADWPIPANTWSHQGTWITALNDIAASVGGYVQPHDTGDVLRILPRYPVRSWKLADAAPDLELPPGIASVEEVSWLTKPDYDAIYLHGQPGTSLFYRKRAVAPGNQPAPMAVHPLLIHPDAAAQRAIAELSDTGRQIEQQLTLMVLPETGVIHPGTLLRYTDDGAARRTGIVRAVQVRQAGARIEQAITVQAHEQ